MKRIIILSGAFGMLVALSALPRFLPMPAEKPRLAAKSEIRRVYDALPPQAQALYLQQSDQLTKPVPGRLVELDQLTIGCFGPGRILSMDAAAPHLGGQCCGVLRDVDAYTSQLQALNAFTRARGIEDLVPPDPYDIPVDAAKRFIGDDQRITLDADRQKTYDAAMAMSHHGGPCCCKCWKWFMMSGVAKRALVERGLSAEELAQLWDLSSSCGHDEDTNMQKHYS